MAHRASSHDQMVSNMRKTHYDDGGYVDSGTTTTFDPSSSFDPSYGSTDSSGSADLSPEDTSAAQYQGRTNQLEAQHNINAIDSASGAPQGALSSALSALGSKQGSAVLSALTGILGAAGHYNQAKAYSKLPTMPSMGGPLPSLPGQGGSTGY